MELHAIMDNSEEDQRDISVTPSTLTRATLDSGFRSCSEGESPSYTSSCKLRLNQKQSAISSRSYKYVNEASNNHDDVFSEGDTAEVFFAASALDDDVVLPRRQMRKNTVSLPVKQELADVCQNSECHCSACCSCMPVNKSRATCHSLNLSNDKYDSDLNDSNFSIPLLPAPNSPTMISSWGHYNHRSDWHYKYARSDYSSDSDEEFTFHRCKSKPEISRESEHEIDVLHKHESTNKKNTKNLCDTRLTYNHKEMSPTIHTRLTYNHKEMSPTIQTSPDNTVCFPGLLEKNNKFELLCNSQGAWAGSTPFDLIPADVDSKPNLSPAEFHHDFQAFTSWFHDLSHEHRNTTLHCLLSLCDLPQIHLLSVRLQDRLHEGCPENCQDILTWVPANVTAKVFTYLDPVSLCQASQVCWLWYNASSNPSLWRRFCCRTKWRLSKPAEHKQVVRLMSPEGSIQWKKVFAERYRLRRNWLTGRCSVRTFEGHMQGISCVQFDDTRIVSGSSDKTIKVWNIRTNAPWSVQTLVGHSGTVRCLHLGGNKLVSGSTDRSIKVWDLSTQDSWSSIACKVTMVGHLDTVRCLQVDDDKVISGSYDKTLKVWDIRTGDCRNTLRGHMAAVLCVYFNDTKIVSGSCDKTIKVWNYEECLMTLEGHKDAVTCLQFDATRIISGSLDCTLKFWDIHTGCCVNTIDWRDSEGHTGVIRCLQADSWRLVSAADDKTLKVWNLETGERLVTLKNHTDGVTCMQFNDFVIVSGSYDKTVKLWDFSCC